MALQSLFIDFNSYFASVEQQLRPELRGKPVGVAPVMAETTCCIAASYEAKAFGIRTGTQVREARRLCPGIEIVHARPPLYVGFHHKLVAAVRMFLDVDKVLSIDEMVCSLTGELQQRDNAVALAKQIKNAIRALVGTELRSSIGIAPNGYLAKVASKMQKPDGLVVIEPNDLPEILFRLELQDLHGIGKRMEQRLHDCGIHTVEQLCNANKRQLQHAWRGIAGERLYDLLRGRQVYTPPTQRSSLGHSHVLSPDARRGDLAFAILNKLLQKAATRLRHDGLLTGCLWLHLKYLDKNGWQNKLILDATDDTLTLLHGLKQLWQRRPDTKTPLLRVGVVLADLSDQQQQSLSLFAEDTRHVPLNRAVDKINERFGRHTVYFGGAHQARENAPMRIAFTHIPDLKLEGDA
ncbi:MAG: DNA polymerase [Gammaproteobacteria bacterium]